MTATEAPGRLAFAALGTTAELLTFPAEALARARSVLEDELAAIDAACSRFRSDAELVALNHSGGRWVKVSPLLFRAAEVALVAARQTGGSVDPTVGTAMNLLGYNCDFSQLSPGGSALQVTLGPVPGWQVVGVDKRRLRLRLPVGVELDLGATAKALAADLAAERAAAVSGAGVLVALGGDLSAAGPPPPGGWPVRVTDDHRGPVDTNGQSVYVVSGGLATSSTVTRAWRRGGDALHHIVDPSTGCPARGPWRTVSVAAATCVDANTAATAAIVRGEGAPGWLDQLRLPARLVGHDGTVRTVGGWPEEQP